MGDPGLEGQSAWGICLCRGILLCGASPLQVNGLLSIEGNINFKRDNGVIQLLGLSIVLLIPTMTCAWLSWRGGTPIVVGETESGAHHHV